MVRVLVLYISLQLLFLYGYSQCLRPNTQFSSCNFNAIGHRGYSHLFPENTLLAVEEAFKRGVKYCEIDIALTADNKYILFHDQTSIYRTTNGQGAIDELTLEQLRKLDIGIWRGPYFKGLQIPTLEEAIQLAEKYDSYLYLDAKVYNLQLIADALKNSKARADRIIIPLANVEEGKIMRSLLPNTPWVWYNGGLFPDNVFDDQFYIDSRNNGCIAYEISSGYVVEPEWPTFLSMVHQHNGKVWIFTVNDPKEVDFLVNQGVDGVETDRCWDVLNQVCSKNTTKYPDSLTTGNWRFNNTLSSNGIGSQLRPMNYRNPSPNQLPQFNNCSSFGISNLNNSNANVMLVPKQDSENGLLVYSGFEIQDYGIEIQQFTIAMDILIPSESMGKWISIYQTGPNNVSDADLFINPNGAIGILDEYSGKIEANTWYRFIFTVDNKAGVLKKYLDGQFIGSNAINSNRWTVYTSSPTGENQGFLIFSDNDDETAPVYISSLQLRDYVLTDSQIAKLSKANENGIPIGNADIWLARIDGYTTDSTFLNYENQSYYITLPENADLSNLKLNFDLSSGAKSNIQPGVFQDFSKGPIQIEVKSNDGMQTKQWSICVSTSKFMDNKLNELDENPFLIYPNPASNNISIQNLDQHYDSFVILNAQGQQIMSFENANSVNISELSPGLYFIMASTNNNSKSYSTMRFIKQD